MPDQTATVVTVEDAAERIASRLAPQEGFGFDWTILVDFAASLLADCLSNRSPEAVAAAMKDRGATETFRLRRACRSMARESGRNFHDLYHACCDAIDAAGDDECLSLCRSVAGPGSAG